MSAALEGSASPGPVLVVIPCLNEKAHIEDVVNTLASETAHIVLQIVVADGGSTDGTCEIVRRLSASNPKVTLMHNPERIQAAGINRAVRKFGANAKFLIRADAHASYPKNYCQTLLEVQARTQADSVVVGMRTVGHTCFQKAAAAAQNSVLGNGGSAHRNNRAGRWVDHGHHALMTIEAFTAVGGYDEAFSHNEDAELDARLVDKGFRIYLTDAAQVTYFPRGSANGLFRQYFNIGRGRARNLLKHRKTSKLRHLVLAAVAPALCLMLLTPFAGWFAVPALAWAFLCLGCGIFVGARLRDRCAMGAGIAAMAMQAGWSFGFFSGLLPAKAMPAAASGAVRRDQAAR